MNSINEKEKKLNLALEELKNLDLTNPDLRNNIENLSLQKNQLEIEKNELEKKYKQPTEDFKEIMKRKQFLYNRGFSQAQIESVLD